MAIPPDYKKRPMGPPPSGTGRPPGPPMPSGGAPRPPNPNVPHGKKPMGGHPPHGKKIPIKGAIKRPAPPPMGGDTAPVADRQPIAPPQPIKPPIAPPPPFKREAIAPPPPFNKVQPQEVEDFEEDFEDIVEEAEPIKTPAPTMGSSGITGAPPPFVKKAGEEDKKDEEDKGRYDNNFAADLNLPPAVLKTKVITVILITLFVSGLIAGRFFGQSSGKVVSQGLQGVIENPEVPRGRLRCGVAEKGQGCVLYLVNPERREVEARNFYSLAGQLTGVQEFLIQTGNMRYANTRIRPGHFAQINIPPIQ